MLLMLLTGCGYDLIGRWELITVTVGETTVEDAGFLDLAEGSVARGFAPNVYLSRYRLTPDGSLSPDPSPTVRVASASVEAIRDDPDGERMTLDFPGTTADTPASLRFAEKTPSQLLLEDPDFFGGQGMTWYLER